MLSSIGFCRILFLTFYVVTELSSGSYSPNSTDEEWCYFKPLPGTGQVTFCKLNCWSNPTKFLPIDNRILRNSIISLNVQISNKHCTEDINFNNFQNMKSLTNFLINGHITNFNLTLLLTEAPGLKQLMIISYDLIHLIVDNLPESQLNSIYLVGGFDPKRWEFIESSRKTLKSFHLALKFKMSIPRNLFINMPEIEFIALQLVSDKISSNSFSNLPKLLSLSINNYNYNDQTKFEKNVFNNLPALEMLKVINLNLEYSNNTDMFCYNISKNIKHFILEASSVLFVERCMDVWNCIECGIEGSGVTQTMEFKSLMTSLRHQYQMKVDDILPDPDRFYYLNTTKLILIDTHVTTITNTSLPRLPLLTHYHHHRSWRSDESNKPFNSFGDIDRFEDNPFETFSNDKSKLAEVKISISICDCVSYKVYLYLIDRNVSVYFYCQNLANEFESVNVDTWISNTFFKETMQVRCTALLISLQLELLFSCLCFLFFRFIEI